MQLYALLTLATLSFAQEDGSSINKFLSQARQISIANDESQETIERPIIGVLTTNIPSSFDSDSRFDYYDSYIEEAYVKWIESAGGRVLPIIYEGDTLDYEYILKRINGLLIPGSYGDSSHEIWVHSVIEDVLQRVDSYGKIIPIAGINLGMRRLTEYFHPDSQSSYVLKKSSTSMDLTTDASSSYLFTSTRVQLDKFESEQVFYHSHSYGIKADVFTSGEEHFKVLATFPDGGDTFAAVIEGVDYPMYGFQFNPEKAIGGRSKFNPFPTSGAAVQLNRYFADKFVFMCKSSNQSFGWYSQEVANIVNAWSKIETEKFYGGMYLFSKSELYIL